MGSVLKLLAPCAFAAVGMGIAVGVAVLTGVELPLSAEPVDEVIVAPQVEWADIETSSAASNDAVAATFDDASPRSSNSASSNSPDELKLVWPTGDFFNSSATLDEQPAPPAPRPLQLPFDGPATVSAPATTMQAVQPPVRLPLQVAQLPPETAPGLGGPALPSLGEAVNQLQQSNTQRNQAYEQIRSELTPPRPATPPPVMPLPAASAPIPDNLPPPVADAANSGGRPATPSSFKVGKLPTKADDRLSVHIQNRDLREVLDFLGEHGDLSILASNAVQGKVSVSLTDVTIDEALAAILKSTGFVARKEGKFVYVGTLKDIQAAAQSIDRIGTRVYRPNYVKASELAPLIMPLLSPAGSVSGPGGGNIAVATSVPSQVGIEVDGSKTGGDQFAQGEVLVVRDYEAVLGEVDQVIAEIDKRPMQVAIESMLLSVTVKDTNFFGVDFQFLRDQQHVLLATGSPLADLGNVSFTDGGLKFGFLDSSLGAFVSALQTIGDTNIIAAPQLMCLNKQKAEILIGKELGYVTKTLTQTTTAQTVEFLKVGTQLRLRPFISVDGLIRMEVHPEISTGTVEVKEGMTLPNKEVTQVTTNIMVRDGCTVVIGGLMQESLGASGSQVPLLGSMPGIGFLFRSRKNTQDRSEIIVLITPHIVYEPEVCLEGEQAACDFHRQHFTYRDQMAPLSSRTIGRKFFRQAQVAWASNDRAAAMRFVNLGIHFDPSNRAAIDLRADILANNHFGSHTGPPVAPNMLPAQATGSPAIATWVLDNLEQGIAGDVGLHPRDPGMPGRAIRVQRYGELR